MLIPLLSELLRNISLLISLVLLQYMILSPGRRSPAHSRLIGIVQGLSVGFIAVVLMNNSFVLRPGLIFDSRTILLSVSGLYFGALPTLLGCLIAGIYRFSLGGQGMVTGILSILASGGLGVLAGKTLKREGESRYWLKLLLFGFLVQAVVLLFFLFFLPPPLNRQVVRGTALPFLLLYPPITALVGRLMTYQINHFAYTLKLEESNNLHRSLFFDSHSIMLMVHPESGAILDANRAAAEFYGWSPAELKRMNVSDLRQEGDSRVRQDLEAVRKDRMNYFQTIHRRADGEPRTVEVHTNFIDDKTNPFVLSIIHDITERIRTERQLKKSEYQLNRAEIMSSLGIWELDLKGNEFHISRGALEIYGLEKYTNDIKLVQSVPLPEYRAVLDRALSDLIGGKGEYNLTFRIRRLTDNRIRIIHSVAEYDRSDDTVFGVIHDITDIVAAQDRIIEEKERLDVTLHSIGDGVITTDEKGLVQILNPVAEELTGWLREEAVGRPLPEVFHIVDEYTGLACENPADLVLKSGRVVELANHTMLLSKNGKVLAIADSGAPIKDRSGSIIGTVLVFRDTTEKQMLHNRMQRAERLESLGVLAGGIAHDFNNLLTGIFGYLELARNFTKEDSIREYLDAAFQVYNRTIDLTKQLLTFSKGHHPLRKTGDLKPLIQESVSFSLSGSSVTCRVDLDENLHHCHFDRNQIGQVLDNLLINAKQAMPGGGVIRLTGRNLSLEEDAVHNLPGGDYVCIAIEDSGQGIPKEVLPRIFDPFFTTKELGSGLGLATCYSIMEKHDGAIDVRSDSTGTTFRFFLPAVLCPGQEDQEQSIGSVSFSGSILIMDDEPYIRQILRGMLESMNFTVLEASNGDDLLVRLDEIAREGRKIRAAILDLTVPGGMGGVDTLGHMKSLGYDFPVFASSGYSEDPVIAFPGNYGFTGSISKPFISGDLASLLSCHLAPDSE